MANPVTVVSSGGVPVVDVTPLSGTALTNPTSYGVPVTPTTGARIITIVVSGAPPVVFIDVDGVTYLPGGSVEVVPAAPALTWNSTSSDTTPDFLVDLPSGNVNSVQDAAAGDHLIIEYQLQSGGSWTQYLDRTLISGDISTDTISATGVTPVASGDYYFRARIERSPLIGTNSSNTSVTIAITVPVNSVAPVISGNVQVGQTLTTTDGTWSNSPTGYTYQWKRDGASIGGATANTRVLSELDAGAAMTCEVVASNGAGAGTAAASNSLTIDVYVVLTASIADGTDATTYSGGSWNTVSLGTAVANRKILIGFVALNTTTSPSISSGSVGAASGSEVTAEEQPTNGLGAWLWEYANTADATANISTTFAAAGQLRLGASVFAVYGAGAGTGYHALATTASSVANNSVVTPTNGAAVSIYGDRSAIGTGTISWTNSTAAGTEASLEGTGTTIDAAIDTSAGTANISASTSNGSLSALVLCTVGYGPA